MIIWYLLIEISCNIIVCRVFGENKWYSVKIFIYCIYSFFNVGCKIWMKKKLKYLSYV